MLSHKIAATMLAAFVVLATAECALAQAKRGARQEEFIATRSAGPPVLAVVALAEQRVTIYDAEGQILRAPISTGQPGYETPAGIYSVIGKEAEHYSNLYDDASMPFMQRITWSGIALHAGALPGRPASHGCVRMPFPFAERLFGMTKMGMRVVIVRNDITPVEFSSPLLFKRPPVADNEVSLIALNEAERPSMPSPTLRSIADAKSAAAAAATKKADEARRAAVAKRAEAVRLARGLRPLELEKAQAGLRLNLVQRSLDSVTVSAEAKPGLEEEKASALAKLNEVQAKLDAAKAEVQLLLDAAEAARRELMAADAAKLAAVEEAKEALRKLRPISVFISRNTQRLYVRQGFEPLFESAVTIAEADKPIGTYVLTALNRSEGGVDDVRWSAQSMHAESGEAGASRRPSRSEASVPQTDPAAVQRVLDRISVPQDAMTRISEVFSAGSTLIVSDEPMSKETGKGTDFIILMSGEPQGGIKICRRDPFARYRYNRPMGGGVPYSPFGWW